MLATQSYIPNMASLYKRIGSPYWWLKFKRGEIIKQQSTGLRWSMPLETKQARRLCAERSLEEVRDKAIGGGNADGERFTDWVEPFFHERYRDSKRTLEAATHRWRSLLRYFAEMDIVFPRQISYSTALDYLRWRQRGGAGRNTAIHEIKLLSLIMDEAMKRGACDKNPCAKSGLKRDKADEKPEITYEQERAIREELAREIDGVRVWPEWMGNAFELGIHQGCRLRECKVPMENFRIFTSANGAKEGTVRFLKKGGKEFTTVLHPALFAMVERFQQEGRRYFSDMPALPSKWFTRLFRKLKMRGYCFHCTRVTVVTRLARAGVPPSQAMRYVSHSSWAVHQIYQRLSVDDLGQCLKALTPNQQLQSSDGNASTHRLP